MASSIRHKIYLLMQRVFSGITIAGGYNTQPRVCAGWQEANNCEEECALYVVLGPERFGETELGGRQHVSVEYQVYALIKAKEESLNQLGNGLLQDVRNALVSYRSEINEQVGAVFVGFDDCDTDEGQLSSIGRLVWVQPVVFAYNAGAEW